MKYLAPMFLVATWLVSMPAMADAAAMHQYYFVKIRLTAHLIGSDAAKVAYVCDRVYKGVVKAPVKQFDWHKCDSGGEIFSVAFEKGKVSMVSMPIAMRHLDTAYALFGTPTDFIKGGGFASTVWRKADGTFTFEVGPTTGEARLYVETTAHYDLNNDATGTD